MTDNYRSQEVAAPAQTQTTWWQYMKAYMKVRITEPVGIRISESKVSIMTKLIAVCCLFIYAPTAYYAKLCEAYKDLGWTAESEALGCLEEAKEEDDEGTEEE